MPSQKFLIEAMIAPIPHNFRGLILELGTGTGPLTLRLAKKCPEATIRACEINPILAVDARQNLARAGVNGQVQVLAISAQELLSQIAGQTGEKPSYIISGIPLGNLRRKAVLGLLEAARSALSEQGMFVQAQHFLIDREHVRATFGALRTVPILLNFPPVFVYYARK